MSANARVLAVGTANPPDRYTQEDLASRYRIDDPRIARLFSSSHIQARHLYLPEPDPDGIPRETQGELLAKHLRGALEIGPQALGRALASAGLGSDDLDYLAVTTTTGFLSPGLSAHLVEHLGLSAHVQRADVVGMGCNAGLNGLNVVASWARANPGANAVLLCIEVCSAAYVYEGTMRAGVVNSLFGDGSAAIVVRAGGQTPAGLTAELLGFESYQVPHTLGLMGYDWDEAAGKFSFFLDRDIPYRIGEGAPIPVGRLLDRFGLRQRHVDHWLVHSGGKKVIDAIKYNLGLTAHDVRHTLSVLRDFGNLSSGSVLFSLERLLVEGRVRPGDLGVMMAMGPGTQIETALVRWHGGVEWTT